MHDIYIYIYDICQKIKIDGTIWNKLPSCSAIRAASRYAATSGLWWAKSTIIC